jgi:acetyl esterase
MRTSATRTYSRDGVPPDVTALFEAMAAARPPERVLEAQALRAADPMVAMMFSLGAPAVAREEEIHIPGPGGPMRAIVTADGPAGGSPRPVVLHFHGSGFVIMTPEASGKITKRTSAEARALVVNLEYRLAPEHPYPAALDDAIAAFHWLRRNAQSLGGDPARIALSGDSAGGNIAAGTALMLREAGEGPPAGVAMLCPWLDLTMTSASMRALGPGDPVLDDEVLSYWRSCYVPDRARWKEPLVSPLHADLAGFPPACMVVGGADPLCEEGVQFAEKLQASGGACELHAYDGMPHEFPLFPQLDESTDALSRVTAFLRRVLA